ncbi:MAG: hypothetical protein J5I47_08960 [Vicingus serpentipes]|nr:hypothetical protein [Vicingus serpentipes]
MLLAIKDETKRSIVIDAKELIRQLPEELMEEELLRRYNATHIFYDDDSLAEFTDEDLMEECQLRGILKF